MNSIKRMSESQLFTCAQPCNVIDVKLFNYFGNEFADIGGVYYSKLNGLVIRHRKDGFEFSLMKVNEELFDEHSRESAFKHLRDYLNGVENGSNSFTVSDFDITNLPISNKPTYMSYKDVVAEKLYCDYYTKTAIFRLSLHFSLISNKGRLTVTSTADRDVIKEEFKKYTIAYEFTRSAMNSLNKRSEFTKNSHGINRVDFLIDDAYIELDSECQYVTDRYYIINPDLIESLTSHSKNEI